MNGESSGLMRHDARIQKILLGLFIGGVTGDLLPVILRVLPIPVKALMIMMGLTSFCLGAILAIEAPSRRRMLQGRARAEDESRQNILSGHYASYQIVVQQQQDQALAQRIVLEAQDSELAFHYLTTAGLSHYARLYLPELFTTPEVLPQGYANDDPTIEVPQGSADVPRSPIDLGTVQSFSRTKSARADLDFSWMTPEFALRSKFISASSGSGKSSFMHWNIKCALGANPGMKLIIIDPHLIACQIKAGEDAGLPDDMRLPVWGLHSTAEEEAGFVITDPETSCEVLANLAAEIEDRLNGEVPARDPILLVVDEIDAKQFFTAPKVAANGAQLAEVFDMIASQARKVRVSAMLTSHSLQRQMSGIPAPVLEQVSWVLLGDMLTATGTKWPSDIDAPSLAKERQALQSKLTDKDGRAIVIRHVHMGRTSIETVVMPPPGE